MENRGFDHSCAAEAEAALSSERVWLLMSLSTIRTDSLIRNHFNYFPTFIEPA